MSTQGLPLGFVDAQCWAREVEAFGKKALRHDLPIEQKESYRWIKAYRELAAVQLSLVSSLTTSACFWVLAASA